jgi:hypothetical protein
MSASEKIAFSKNQFSCREVREFPAIRISPAPVWIHRKEGFSKLLSRTIAKLIEMLRFRCRFR